MSVSFAVIRLRKLDEVAVLSIVYRMDRDGM